MERQRAIQTNDAQQDVLALAQDGLDAMAQVLIIRGGRMIGGDSFALPGEGNEPPQSVLTEFAPALLCRPSARTRNPDHAGGGAGGDRSASA